MMFVTQLRQKDCKDMNDIWHREKLKEYFYPEKSTISVRVRYCVIRFTQAKTRMFATVE